MREYFGKLRYDGMKGVLMLVVFYVAVLALTESRLTVLVHATEAANQPVCDSGITTVD
jgi:hypothetical protein